MDPVNLSLKVPAIEKLIDYGASGVGAIAGPLLAPWKASRAGKARLEFARIDAEVRLIEAQSEATTSEIIAKARMEAQQYLLPSDAEVSGTVAITREDIAQSFEFQGKKRLTNARAVLEGAADELGDKEVDDHEPDPDWTARFFDCVQDVSSEDMQNIWAKILAGEVESPGRTSLRTLDTLRNMTKRDAEMFRDICDFVISNEFVFYDDSVKSIEALNYSRLLPLQDCGLINLGPFLMNRMIWDNSGQIILVHAGHTLMIAKNTNAGEEILQIPEIVLTTVGKELLQFAQCALQIEYLQAFSAFLKPHNCQLFLLEGIMPLPDGRLRYSNRILIQQRSEQVDGATP